MNKYHSPHRHGLHGLRHGLRNRRHGLLHLFVGAEYDISNFVTSDGFMVEFTDGFILNGAE